MAKRSQGKLPPPPYRLKIHRDAPPRDRAYRAAKERLELVGWFEHATRNLAGLAAAAERDPRAWSDEHVIEVEALGQRFMRMEVGGLAVFLWVSSATRTVYVLHSERHSMLKRIGKSTLGACALRLKHLKALDAERADEAPQS